jgi:hypothetical protein
VNVRRLLQVWLMLYDRMNRAGPVLVQSDKVVGDAKEYTNDVSKILTMWEFMLGTDHVDSSLASAVCPTRALGAPWN